MYPIDVCIDAIVLIIRRSQQTGFFITFATTRTFALLYTLHRVGAQPCGDLPAIMLQAYMPQSLPWSSLTVSSS